MFVVVVFCFVQQVMKSLRSQTHLGDTAPNVTHAKRSPTTRSWNSMIQKTSPKYSWIAIVVGERLDAVCFKPQSHTSPSKSGCRESLVRFGWWLGVVDCERARQTRRGFYLSILEVPSRFFLLWWWIPKDRISSDFT